MKIPPVNQRNYDGSALQLESGRQPAKSSSKNDNPMLLFHALCPLERNLAPRNIISLNESGIVNLPEHSSESNGRPQLERNTLRLLCSVLIKPGTRLEICRLLDVRLFQDPLLRVVFEEIHALGGVASRQLRQLLPARVTNREFPDFDLHELLAPHQASEADIDKLFESVLQLLDQCHPDEEQLSE
jgi:hypothetical protein